MIYQIYKKTRKPFLGFQHFDDFFKSLKSFNEIHKPLYYEIMKGFDVSH